MTHNVWAATLCAMDLATVDSDHAFKKKMEGVGLVSNRTAIPPPVRTVRR